MSTETEVRAVEQRLRRARPAIEYHDYIVTPRESGYRSVHYVVTYTDRAEVPRRIEIQLRTEEMHRWALLVEALSSAAGINLKGDGDHRIQQFLAVLSQVSALRARGEPAPAGLIQELEQRRIAALASQEEHRE